MSFWNDTNLAKGARRSPSDKSSPYGARLMAFDKSGATILTALRPSP